MNHKALMLNTNMSITDGDHPARLNKRLRLELTLAGVLRGTLIKVEIAFYRHMM
jgi:hypothetical protein